MDTQARILQLNDRLTKLEDMLNRTPEFEELIRDITLFDVDNVTSPTQTITIGAGGGSATVPANPNYYVKAYFRGKVVKIPVF